MTSWLLLALGVLSWWAVLTALVRWHRPTIFGSWTMLASWMTADLPLFHIVWEAVLVVFLAWLGPLDQAVGVIGFLAVLASWGGLFAVWLLQGRARPTSIAALEAGLGPHYLDELPDERRASLRTRARIGQVLRPFHFDKRGLIVEKGIAYGDHPSRNLLDIYRPAAGGGGLRPVLLQIHGGAWVIGNKWQQALPLMHHLSRRGWVSVAINYRLGPTHKFPDQLVDVKRALAWVRANIADYGGDPDLVVITGGSAGGHLAALAALTANRPEYQPGFETVDTSVIACMPFYGPTDFTDAGRIRSRMDAYENFLRFTVMPGPMSAVPELYSAMSPLRQIHPGAPPFFILQGKIDVLVWWEENRYFSEQLSAVSRQPVVYWEVPFAQHMFDTLHSRRSSAAVEACERFVEWAVARARTGTG